MDLDFKKLQKIDPLAPQPTVDLTGQQGASPFDSPDEYSKALDGVSPENFHPYLRGFVDEHVELVEHLDSLEKWVTDVRAEGKITAQQFGKIQGFFEYFENDLIAHNRREERELFAILRRRMLERGEHSSGPDPITPVSVLEAEHIQGVQIAAVAKGFCALAHRLEDAASLRMVLSIALERCEALVKMMRLHVFREDRIVFVLAQEYLTSEEFEALPKGMA